MCDLGIVSFCKLQRRLYRSITDSLLGMKLSILPHTSVLRLTCGYFSTVDVLVTDCQNCLSSWRIFCFANLCGKERVALIRAGNFRFLFPCQTQELVRLELNKRHLLSAGAASVVGTRFSSSHRSEEAIV